MLCYHKEYFALGFLSAFFIFAIVTLFEDVIGEWIEGIRKGLGFYPAYEPDKSNY